MTERVANRLSVPAVGPYGGTADSQEEGFSERS